MKYLSTALLVLILNFGQSQSNPILKTLVGNIELDNNIESLLQANTSPKAGHYILQFKQIPTQDKKEALTNSGLVFHDYLPDLAYLVSIPQNFDLSALDKQLAHSLTEIPPSLKINPNILNGGLEAKYYNSSNELQVIMSFFKDVSRAQIDALIDQYGLRITEFNTYVNRIKFNLAPEDLSSFTEMDEVKFIDVLIFNPEPEDQLGKALHRSNSINQNNPLGPKYDGTGVNVAVNDDGFVGPHIDFTGRTEQSDVAGDFTGDHGDMVAGILGGAGNLDPLQEGMAKGAFLRIRQYSSSLPNTVTLHQNDTVVIFSSSYSNGCNAGYTSLSQQVDMEIRQNPSLIQVFSAGNNGTSNCGYGAGSGWGNITGGHKQGKNVIATANMERDEGLANSSSRGPAMDGRIKPDITAHGNGQISTDPNNTYDVGGGTSAAAPGISGVLAQLYHAYKTFNGGNNPESALLKAALMNAADDLGNVGPDFQFGWGRVNGRRALEVIENNQYFVGDVNQFDTDVLTLNIPAGVAEARIMLYWSDYEGNPIATTALVNDLDLEVDNGSTLLPWILDHTPNATNLDAPATTGVDHLNNVEQVVINNPSAGNVSISVNGFNIPQGPQKYYVVYNFVYDDIEVIYPNAGEGFVPGETERIFWDAHGNAGNFNLEYSVDGGGSWTNITSVGGSERSYDWTVPNMVSGQARVRVSRGGIMDVSDTNFTIIETPENIQISQVCSNSISITWDAVPNAYKYEVYLLGNKFMDPIGTTYNTVFQIPANINVENWISVSAIAANDTTIRGRRAIAIYYNGSGVFNCAFPQDAATLEVLSPSNTFACDYDNVPVEIEIANFGQTPISNFGISYQVAGQGVVTETYTGTVVPGQVTSYQFSTPLTISSFGNHSLSTWVSLSGDMNNPNDTATIAIDYGSTLINSFPAIENFDSFTNCGTASDCETEQCSLINGWNNVNNGTQDDIDWRTNDFDTPSNNTGPDNDHTTGTNGKYLYLEASGGCEFMEAQLYSPCIDLSNAFTAEFSFWYHMLGADMGDLHIDVFDGSSWNLDVMTPLSGNQGNSWQQQMINLDSYVGDIIQIRFRGVTGDGYRSDISLDDINIDIVGLDTDDPEIVRNFKLYPNPSNGLINLSYDMVNKKCSSIQVLDARGREVYSMNQNQIKAFINLDLSHLESGMYTVRLLSDGAEFEKRIVLK